MAMSAQQGQRRRPKPGAEGDDRSLALLRFARRVESELRQLRRAERIRRVAGKRFGR